VAGLRTLQMSNGRPTNVFGGWSLSSWVVRVRFRLRLTVVLDKILSHMLVVVNSEPVEWHLLHFVLFLYQLSVITCPNAV